MTSFGTNEDWAARLPSLDGVILRARHLNLVVSPTAAATNQGPLIGRPGRLH